MYGIVTSERIKTVESMKLLKAFCFMTIMLDEVETLIAMFTELSM